MSAIQATTDALLSVLRPHIIADYDTTLIDLEMARPDDAPLVIEMDAAWDPPWRERGEQIQIMRGVAGTTIVIWRHRTGGGATDGDEPDDGERLEIDAPRIEVAS